MDSATTLSLTAIVIAAVSLLSSTAIAFMQVRMMRNANYLPLITGLVGQLRSRRLYDDLVYVTTRLRTEHDPARGISGLPDPVRAAVLNVGFYYQAFAWLVDLRVLRREPVLDNIRQRILVVWPAIEPFVAAERRTVPGPILQLLERVYDDITATHPCVLTRFRPEGADRRDGWS